MRRRLLTVQGPLQFISGYIAFTSAVPGASDVAPTEDVLLLYDFLCDPEIEEAIAKTIYQLSRVQPWRKVVLIRSHEMAAMMLGRYANCIRRLHKLLGQAHFDEIYLARDHVGHGSPLLMNAYPNAVKRAYGDSLGLVGQHALMQKNTSAASVLGKLVAQARGRARRLLLGQPRHIPFDEAVLTLPMDLSGTYFEYTPLRVPGHAHVVDVVERIYAAMPELSTHCDSLRQQGSAAHDHLYLLSNLAASSLSLFEQEINLYVEIINATAAPGSTVYLKPHPRSSLTSLEETVQRLGNRYRVVVIDDPALCRIPIELWVELVRNCTVVAIYSTSATNLKYLYGKEVSLPLDDNRIHKYFSPVWVDYVRKVNRMNQESMANLASWDGRSALWSAIP